MSAFIHQLDDHVLHSRHPWRRGAGLAIAVAGTVILATNFRQNIDEAFLRRIQVLIDFPFPDAAARAEILRGLFPEKVERPGDGELADVARRFELAGGSLKNVVLEAAFRAAAQGQPRAVTLRHLIGGVAREYQKLGRAVTPSEFGPEFYRWAREDLDLGPEPKPVEVGF